MQILKDLCNNVMLLDDRVLLNEILTSPVVQKWIIQMNQDQLFKEGVNSNGTLLEDIGGGYSIHTILGVPGKYPGKIELGLPTQWITLYNTGEFYDSFKVELSLNQVEITANPIKDGVNIFNRWGKEVLGLTDDNLQKLIDFIRAELIPKIKEQILAA
jgi:hypothetical protein